MPSYPEYHAGLYDLFYREKPYSDEVKFLNQQIQLHSPGTKKLLELACGTGNHAFILEKYGYQVTAVDYSYDMISIAEKKKIRFGSAINFFHSNMSDLSCLTDTFDVTICLFDSIGYLRTNEAIFSTFHQVYNHLNTGGLFIIEYWNAFAMAGHYEPIRKKIFKLPDRTIVRISETEIDYKKQIASVHYTIFEHLKVGTFTEFQETQKNRFFSPQELIIIGESNGFKVLGQYSGYSECNVIDDKNWHILIVFKKPSELFNYDM